MGARLVPAALGSDTGGSIRQPASFCGIVGLKPTYGRVSRYGLVAFASSLDQIGPMTTSVEDAAILLQAITGVDHMDSTSLPLEAEDFIGAVKTASVEDFKTLKIGLPEEYFNAEGMSSEVKEVIEQAVEKVKAAGAEIVPVSLPHTKYAVAVYYILCALSSLLSRLLDDCSYLTGTYCSTTFTDSEAKTLLHSDWVDEFYCHFDVITWHAHFCTSWKVTYACYVCCSEVELWTIVVEEWSMTTTFILC